MYDDIWNARVGDVLVGLAMLGLLVLGLVLFGFVLEVVMWPFHKLRDWLEDWGWQRKPYTPESDKTQRY